MMYSTEYQGYTRPDEMNGAYDFKCQSCASPISKTKQLEHHQSSIYSPYIPVFRLNTNQLNVPCVCPICSLCFVVDYVAFVRCRRPGVAFACSGTDTAGVLFNRCDDV